MKLVDSHSHLFLEEFKEDLPQVMARARAAEVTHIFMPNIDSTTIEPMLRVCRAYKGYCYPMIGLHPTSVNADYVQELEVMARELGSSKEYVAIGEIGMDLYWDKTFLKEQEMALNRQIEWALEYDLPVVIHCREAFDYIYNVLKPYQD
ncbi:TatD family hydrolase, partial [Bacteroides heparinolyticus]